MLMIMKKMTMEKYIYCMMITLTYMELIWQDDKYNEKKL